MTSAAGQLEPQIAVVHVDVHGLAMPWVKQPEIAEITLDASAFAAFDSVLEQLDRGAELPRADFTGFRFFVPDPDHQGEDTGEWVEEGWKPFELPLKFMKASVSAQGFYVEAHCKEHEWFLKAGPLPFDYVQEQARLWRAQELAGRLEEAMPSEARCEPRRTGFSGPSPL